VQVEPVVTRESGCEDVGEPTRGELLGPPRDDVGRTLREPVVRSCICAHIQSVSFGARFLPADLGCMRLQLTVLGSLAVVILLVGASARAGTKPTVVLDPGHDLRANLASEPIGPGSSTRKILDGGGTSGVVTGVREADLNLAIALRLRTLLQHAGVRIVMTRTTTLHTSMGNIARAAIANREHAALFLRIHADGSSDPRADGTHTLYPARLPGWTDDVYARSRRAAHIVQDELVRALGFPDRGLQEHADFTGFNWSNVPVILVEVGFMTNPTEDRLLATPDYRQRAAVGLCRGTLRYLGRSSAACG
jgi:N-acetylmuramoyl-L-alanine amidase